MKRSPMDGNIQDALEEARTLLQEKRSTTEDGVIERSTTVQVKNPEPKTSETSAPGNYEVTFSSKTVTSQPNSDDEEEFGQICIVGIGAWSDTELLGTRSRKGSCVVRGAGSEDEGASVPVHTTIRYRRRRGGQWRRLVEGEKEEEASKDEDELRVEVDERLDEKTGQITKTVEATWNVMHFETLPEWMKDNEFLRTGHRPPLPSVAECFRSIWSLHTETGNIWTHLIGCILFLLLALWFLTRPDSHIQFQEKLVFSFFFIGAVVCMGLSFAFHTLSCHSANVLKVFCKLDYMGISLLIVGSFIPWIYYGFYCRREPKITYIALISVLGVFGIIVSMWDKFSESKFRPVRAGVFVAMGCSGVVPTFHYIMTDGVDSLFQDNAFHWLLLMAALYLTGAALYATRTPERFFPGKCDIWFQSHQLFHTCVVIAALVHYYGISEMAMVRLNTECPKENVLPFHDEL